jgi:hypothetical protein
MIEEKRPADGTIFATSKNKSSYQSLWQLLPLVLDVVQEPNSRPRHSLGILLKEIL